MYFLLSSNLFASENWSFDKLVESKAATSTAMLLGDLHTSPVFDFPNRTATSTPMYNEPDKKNQYTLPDDQPVDWIVIRFIQRARIRFRNKMLKHVKAPESAALTHLEKSKIKANLASFNRELNKTKHTVKPSLGLSESILDKWHKNGERLSKTKLRNLNNYYQIPFDKGTRFGDVKALLKRLNNNPVIDRAYAEAQSNYVAIGNDSYDPGESFNSSPAEGGVNAEAAWAAYGNVAKGANITVVSVESYWQKSHDDFPINLIGFEAIEDPVLRQAMEDNYDINSEDSVRGSHGNAGIGVVAAPENGFGATGIVPLADVGLQSTSGGSTCTNITYAAIRAGYGGVVLIPLAFKFLEEDHQHQYYNKSVPLDFVSSCFDAIQNATANKVIIVIGSGNNFVDLDDPYYEGRFDITQRDSGAIVTGVSRIGLREPYSNQFNQYVYGYRIDAHAPGESLATIGVNNTYGNFGQNSGSTAVIAGAISSIQSIARGAFGITLSAREMRSLIKIEGVAQTGLFGRPIASLPDILKAAQIGIPRIKAIRAQAAALVPPAMLLLD